MANEDKRTEQLVQELETLRGRVAAFEQDEARYRQLEETLRTSEAIYRSLFEETRDVVYVTSNEGKLIDINHAGLDLFGLTREEIAGLKVSELYVDPDDRHRFQELIEQEGFVKDYEVRLRRSDGTEIDCLLTSTVRLASDDSVIGYQGIIRDVTDRKRMEGKLLERRRALHMVISSLPNALLVVGESDDLSAFFLPPSFPPIFKADRLSPGETLDQVLLEQMAAETLAALAHVRETGRIRTFEQAITLGEEDYFFKVKVSPVADSDDLLIMVDDITARKRMEEKLHERRRTLHMVISSMPNALLVVDEADRLTAFFFPPNFPPIIKADKLFPEELLIEVLPDQLSVQIASALGLVREVGEMATFEQAAPLDGEDLFFKVKVSPVADSDDILVVIDDITDLKHAEETVRRYANDLEERNRELDAFSHTVAHDLKAPLSSILMYAEVVLADEKERMSSTSKGFLRDIQKSVFVMKEMVDSLLLFAKLRDAKGLVEEVEMEPVVQSVLTRLRSAITERGVNIEVMPDPPAVMGYGPWLEEVLANLASNAVKYIGKDNTDPQITIHGHREDDRVRYEVRDNGLGITPEDQEKLFQMFSRFHKDEARGTGLGLSIVHRIITKLGGEVGAESTPGDGSTFWFTLPAPPS